jgi:hypothetical protein
MCEKSSVEQSAAKQVAEKVPLIVIPNEVRNLSPLDTQEKRDSSARGVPRFTVNVHRERNDDLFVFSATCKAGLKTGRFPRG